MILCWGLQTPLMHFLLGDEYEKAPGLLGLSSSLLFLVPLFFLTDSLGFTHFMVLRAYKDARYTMCVALVSYWILALPIMWIGLKHWGWQDPVSLWWVMIGGSVLNLCGQAARFAYRYKKALM